MIKTIITYLRSLTPFARTHEVRDLEGDDGERAARSALRASTDDVNAVADGASKRRTGIFEMLDDTLRTLDKQR